MRYDEGKGDFANAYNAYKTAAQEVATIQRGVYRVPGLLGGALFLFCMPGEMIAVLTRVRIGTRAFRIQVIAMVLLAAGMVPLPAIHAESRGENGGGWDTRGLFAFGVVLLAAFAVRLVLIASRGPRGVLVHSEDVGEALPFFYVVSTSELVVRQYLEPLFYGTIALVVWQLDALLGGFIAWATLGQLIESTRLLDAARRRERIMRDAAIEAGMTEPLPKTWNERAYEARRATVVTVAWFTKVLAGYIMWFRRRWDNRSGR